MRGPAKWKQPGQAISKTLDPCLRDFLRLLDGKLDVGCRDDGYKITEVGRREWPTRQTAHRAISPEAISAPPELRTAMSLGEQKLPPPDNPALLSTAKK
jgi:hypothetical protein